MDLNLSKAVDAAEDAIRDVFPDVPPWWFNADEFAGPAIRAALPHILDTLADHIAATAREDYENAEGWDQSNAYEWMIHEAKAFERQARA